MNLQNFLGGNIPFYMTGKILIIQEREKSRNFVCLYAQNMRGAYLVSIVSPSHGHRIACSALCESGLPVHLGPLLTFTVVKHPLRVRYRLSTVFADGSWIILNTKCVAWKCS